jgi:muramoyltetrapeptide carboxypeptidase
MSAKTVGIVAAGFCVPASELKLGVARLEDAGFEVQVHPNVSKRYLFFAGDDEQRLQEWIDYAWDPKIQILWCARGGHGALRLLPLLEAETAKRGRPPRKLLLGYSDTTLFFEFVRSRWGWSVLHSPMPGGREFLQLDSKTWKRLLSWVDGESGQPQSGYSIKPLNEFAKRSSRVQGRLTGGNLTVLTCALGTPFWKPWGGAVVFLEDTGEMWFRIDRMLAHLTAAQAWTGVQGIVLGTYSACRDGTSQVLKPSARIKNTRDLLQPSPKMLEPLRPLIPDRKALVAIFSEWAKRAGGIPVWEGLKTGHGGGLEPLPMGASVRIERAGSRFSLKVSDWDWRAPQAARVTGRI